MDECYHLCDYILVARYTAEDDRVSVRAEFDAVVLAQRIDILTQVAREFDLGEVIAVSTFDNGGPDVVGFATSRGALVVKPSYRDFELRLYATVERTLNARGIRQARLMTTPGGHVSSTTGHCVQEWLGGTTTHRPTQKQV